MKLHTTLALTALTTLTLTLAACDKGAQDGGVQPTEAQLSQLYIKDFDATKEFINLFVNNDVVSFNNSLPTVRRYDFNSILNSLTQNSAVVNYLDSNADADKDSATYNYLVADATLRVNAEFTNTVKAIEADVNKAIIDPQYQFDIKQAYLPVLLKQLSAACVANNNYQSSVDEIASQLISKNDKGEIAPFPEDLKIFLQEWNVNLRASCETSKAISKFLTDNDYSFKKVEEILVASKAQIEQQAAAKKAESIQLKEEELKKLEQEKADAKAQNKAQETNPEQNSAKDKE